MKQMGHFWARNIFIQSEIAYVNLFLICEIIYSVPCVWPVNLVKNCVNNSKYRQLTSTDPSRYQNQSSKSDFGVIEDLKEKEGITKWLWANILSVTETSVHTISVLTKTAPSYLGLSPKKTGHVWAVL